VAAQYGSADDRARNVGSDKREGGQDSARVIGGHDGNTMHSANSSPTAMTMATLWATLCDAFHGDPARGERVVVALDQREMDQACRDVLNLFAPLLVTPRPDRPLVVAHLAQSLDGCIAQANGESHWISGDEDLDHTHRLRAACDVVLVGAETVERDDCALSVRRVEGPHPVRVVLDPTARLSPDRKIFSSPGGATIWITGHDHAPQAETSDRIEVVQLATRQGQFELADVLEVVSARGHRRLFVEGGGITVSHFLEAGLLDRLHLAVAPVLIGGGRPTIGLPLGPTLSHCPRPAIRVYDMGDDWLFDCDLRLTSP